MPSFSVQHVMVDVVVFEGDNLEDAKIVKIAVFVRFGLGAELLLNAVLKAQHFCLVWRNRVDHEPSVRQRV